MHEFHDFYSSKAWQNCRNAYAKSVQGLCERCLRNGLLTPGVIVHHKIPLDAESVNNPDISLNWNNLELLCRNCHAEAHAKNPKRYKVDAMGRVITKDF